MEPVVNNPSVNQTIDSSLAQSSNGEVKLSENQPIQDTQRDSGLPTTDSSSSDAQVIEDLKEQRDQLRGINELAQSKKSNKLNLKTILLITIILLITAAIYFLLLKPSLDKPMTTEDTAQKSFVLPSDLASKSSEEKQALNIIALARMNKSDEIINTYLNRAQLGQSETDFKTLVNSYSSSADGEQVELIEKKVGKVDFASTGESSAIAETTSEFEATSLIYKSGYYRHTNNLYLKINLYRPDPSIDIWKMYSFEFKAGNNTPSLKADIHIPI